MSDKTLLLSAIRLDGGTQCRAILDSEHITTIAEAWNGGAKIPPVVVFYDGTNNWLADGFHRYHSAQECGFRDILAEVRSGTRQDAIKYALGANAAHGLRRTNADKRRAVEIALKEFPKLSDSEIARMCAVNDKTVAAHRPRNLGNSEIEARIGADGKVRKLPERKVEAPDPTIALEPAPSISLAVVKSATGEVAPAPRNAKPNEPISSPSNGMMYARIAIAQLEKIEPNDKEKAAAFELVRNYLVKNGG